MTEPDCGLRERKKRETRIAIHRAALDLVEESGFDAVTTDQIAARAGVSPRTLFNYFPNKESAVLGATPADLDEMRVMLDARPSDEPILHSIRAIVESRLAPTTYGPEVRAQRRRVILNEPSLGPALVGNNIRAENVLTEIVAERLGLDPLASVRPRVTVASALAAVRACIEHQHSGGSGTVEEAVDEAFLLLEHGFA